MFPEDLALSLNDYYRERGVQVLAGETVVGLEARGDQSVLRLRNVDSGAEHALTVDGVVAGIGTQPNVDLARASGLTVGDGIVVDQFLRTGHPDIYAAGDVASVFMPALGERRRVEHEDNAKTMGRVAGRAMAGQPEPYDHLPFFYSDLFDLGFEAVGDRSPHAAMCRLRLSPERLSTLRMPWENLIHSPGLHATVGVETTEEVVAVIREDGRGESEEENVRAAIASPAAQGARVQVDTIHEPGKERGRLLRIDPIASTRPMPHAPRQSRG